MVNKIRLLIADDHTLVREGLLALLDTIPDFEVVGQAADGIEAVQLAFDLHPDLIVLDLVMPQLDGLQVIQQIRARQPEQRILVVTSFSDDERVLHAVQSGASGFLLKDCSSTELIQAIRDIHGGEAHLQPSVARKLINQINPPAEARPAGDGLSAREKSVIALMGKGLANKDIAGALCLSERTIDAHVSKILKKLGLANRTQIVLYAMKEGWIDIHETE